MIDRSPASIYGRAHPADPRSAAAQGHPGDRRHRPRRAGHRDPIVTSRAGSPVRAFPLTVDWTGGPGMGQIISATLQIIERGYRPEPGGLC